MAAKARVVSMYIPGSCLACAFHHGLSFAASQIESQTFLTKQAVCVTLAHVKARDPEDKAVVYAHAGGVMAALTIRPLIQREFSWRRRRFRVSLTAMVARNIQKRGCRAVARTGGRVGGGLADRSRRASSIVRW